MQSMIREIIRKYLSGILWEADKSIVISSPEIRQDKVERLLYLVKKGRKREYR